MRRRPTVYHVPTYDGPPGEYRYESAELEQMRAEEAAIDRTTTMEQLLSRRLAHLYGRDIWVTTAVSYGQFEAELLDGSFGIGGSRLPSERFLRLAPFRRLRLAPDVAKTLLARDEKVEA